MMINNMTKRDELIEMSKTPFIRQPLINRKRLGPFVNGYIKAMLELTDTTSGFDDEPYTLSDRFTKFDIAEYTLAQIIRDCVSFCWRNAELWDEDFLNEFYGEREVGWDFWVSRNGIEADGQGFNSLGGEVWASLHASAKGFGPYPIWVDENNEIAFNWREVAALRKLYET